MQYKVKLTENDIIGIVMGSVHQFLTEETLQDYNQILQNEFIKAQKDVQNSNPSFHHGIRDSIVSKGYIVKNSGDNSIDFYGHSRLFLFHANRDYENIYNRQWVLSDYITIRCENYKIKESWYYTRDEFKIDIDEFNMFYKKISSEIGEPLRLKAFRAYYEDIDNFKKFKVVKVGVRSYQPICEFDNFDKAKKVAYEIADKECKSGKQRNDITRNYFHSSPIDITKYARCLAAYEYYNYDEHEHYIAVEGE